MEILRGLFYLCRRRMKTLFPVPGYKNWVTKLCRKYAEGERKGKKRRGERKLDPDLKSYYTRVVVINTKKKPDSNATGTPPSAIAAWAGLFSGNRVPRYHPVN